MIFKSRRESDEFKQLSALNPRLYQLLNVLTTFTQLEFDKSITLTSIFRTLEEHKALYAGIQDPPTSSPHMFWEAADIRSTDFIPAELNRLITFANSFTFRHGKQVCLYHKLPSNAFHLHIQFSKTRGA